MPIEPILVSELNNQIKSLLEATFVQVHVRGEVSAVTYHSSGHIYFTIKDDKSAIECMMFKGSATKGLRFRLEQGQEIVVEGAISVYVPRGGYKLNCFRIEPYGIGALSLVYEQLKKELESKGYFDRERKKTIPKFLNHIVLVTSSTGAALQDMLRVAQKRWPLLRITTINTLVQGEGAKESIAKNIRIADTLRADVIVVGRGGGSLEDLWAFNEKIVAEAIFEAKTPVVSAVGHEIDVMISDFVADMRAPTPSAAMEMLLPDMGDALLYISEMMDRFDGGFERTVNKKSAELNSVNESLKRYSIDARFVKYQKEIADIDGKLKSYFEYKLNTLGRISPEYLERFYKSFLLKISEKERVLSSLKESFESNNPKKRSKKGFAQIIKDRKISELKNIEIGDEFLLEDTEIEMLAKAISKQKI